MDSDANAGTNRSDPRHRSDIVATVLQGFRQTAQEQADATAAPVPIKAPFITGSEWCSSVALGRTRSRTCYRITTGFRGGLNVPDPSASTSFLK
jgi:hypothetical protein